MPNVPYSPSKLKLLPEIMQLCKNSVKNSNVLTQFKLVKFQHLKHLSDFGKMKVMQLGSERHLWKVHL